MRFSIIIPAHNAADHIFRALDSVKGQTFTDYELIVVCDSCYDFTEDIAKGCGAITVRTDYHRDGLARNAGLDIARGEYVLFMDDDDWWLHEFVLEEINGELIKSNCDILCFGFVWKGVGVTSPEMRRGIVYPNVWGKAWRREAIGDTRFSDEWSVSDLGFTQRMLEKTQNVQLWNMPLYYYNYMREGSITERAKSGKVPE